MKKNIKWTHKARIGKTAFGILLFLGFLLVMPFGDQILNGVFDFIGISGGISGAVLLGGLPFLIDGKFKDISLKELQELTVEEQELYKTEKMKFEASERERLNKEIENLAHKHTKTEDEFKELKQSLEDMSKLIRENINHKNDDKIMTIKEQCLNYFVDKNNPTGKVDIMSKLKTIGNNSLRLKASPSTTSAAITNNTRNYRVPDVARTARPKFAFTDFFPVVLIEDPNSFDELSYTDWDEASITRAAAARAEGGTVATSDLVMQEYTLKLKSIADSFEITKAAMRNAQIFARDIDFFLQDNMLRAINTKLYAGTGAGNEPIGIYTRVPAYDTTAYAGRKVANPGIQDLALVTMKEIMDGTDQDYMPDFAFVDWDTFLELNPYDKDANNNYIVKPTHGLIWIPSSFVTANTMVIGDSSKLKIYKTLDYDYEVGYKTGGFENRTQSVIVETVMNLLIREADLLAFRKITDVATAITNITK